MDRARALRRMNLAACANDGLERLANYQRLVVVNLVNVANVNVVDLVVHAYGLW